MSLNIDKLTLFCCILDFGKGSKALKIAQRVGAFGGTIFLGKGSVKNELLNRLGVLDVRKEIFITIIDDSLEDDLYDEISKKFHLNKSNHGIAFSLPLKSALKINGDKYKSNTAKKGVKDMDYEAIFVIVNKGLSDDVLDAAEAAGSKGGTVIHARGSGSEKKEKLFNIEIEPEKDVVLILSKEENMDKIVDKIEEMLKLTEPGAGILFTLDVNRTLGLYRA
nr:P-II family nitrogen regulator [Tissierella sp.]